ncbi:hypothetical protein M758_2G136500 [Ceratodon purpureus]|nr:hypothetical protein M758_2G136500 [Ceratodon purpureus]
MMSSMAYVWSLMGLVTIIRGFLPPEFQNYMKLWMKKLMKKLWGSDPYCRFHIDELDSKRRTNNLYRVVEMHLRAKHLIEDADDLHLSQEENAKKISFTLGGEETVTENHEGVKVWWTFTTEKSKGQNGGERDENKYVLKMLKADKHFVKTTYMDYIARSAKEYKTQLRDLYLYSCNNERWKAHTFHHPSTFDTLAMDPDSKHRLMTDLQSYMEGEAYFKRVGRAWKRGYLLYGPPGTGKSSLIAAMANRLRYNIYDLELTQVTSNNQLKMLLTSTSSKSIIVIEDIDCSLDLTGTRVGKPQEKPKTAPKQSAFGSSVTLSGLLNFSDGLWSCCGNERIIIFTTNHIEKLDPGLLRPGRMDMHIHMSFCNFDIFKVLAMNYLGLKAHPAFERVQKLLLEENVKVTPAEVTEFLFQHKNDRELALQTLVEDLERRAVEGDAVVVGEADYDECLEVEKGEIEEGDLREEAEEDGKECTRIHCNVKQHQSQGEMLKVYMSYNQRMWRQGGGGRGRGSRTSRY